MNLSTSFTLRFKAVIAGAEFISEVECADISHALTTLKTMESQHQNIELVAALTYLSLALPDGSCDLLDDESTEIYGELLRDELKVGTEHFYNECMGSYDHILNRITPADLGEVFPDGTMRLVWDKELAVFDFPTTVAMTRAAAEVLLQAQKLPYFQQTEDELEEGDVDKVKDRRVELLFAAGLWPDSDNSFKPVPPERIPELLAKYANSAIPA
jgi:hypothetical protein